MAESTFKKNLSDVSKEIVHWKKNMFVLPSGAAERERVEKVTHLIKLWIQNTPLNSLSLKAVHVKPELLQILES